MSTKERLLNLLEQHRGSYCSGQQIAQELGISRAAVWKAVKALEQQGYAIDAVSNRGYCLAQWTDVLSAQGIRRHLPAELEGLEVLVEHTVDSTNTQLRRQANEGAPEGRVLVASQQTQGRGRLGRNFFSPKDTGIYMSILLRPQGWDAQRAGSLTTMAAVVVCRAIRQVSGRQAQIKWVNDVYLEGKKVCGILTEGGINLENGQLDYAVLGVGINAYAPPEGFPQELQSLAGAVFTQTESDGKNRLAAAFLQEFYSLYQHGDPQAHVEEYRTNSLVIGRKVNLVQPGGSRLAKVLDIDEECRLVVEYPDGTHERVSTGEISLRLAD